MIKNIKYLPASFLVGSFFFSPITHSLVHPVQFLRDGVNIENLNCIDDLVTTSNGRWAYAISFCDANISIFERNFNDGTLSFISNIVNDDSNNEEGISPRDVAVISPDDRHLYVAGTTSEGGRFRGAIFVFSIDSATGQLTQQQIFDDINFGSGLQAVITQDGNSLYVAGGNNDMYALSRAGNGQLSLAEHYETTDLSSNLEGSQIINQIKLTQDDSQLYLALRSGFFITMERNPNTGVLTNIAEVNEDNFPEEDWRGITDFTISPDGENIYGFTSGDALLQLRRNTDGSVSLLSLSSQLPNGHNNTQLFCPVSPIVSENGRLVYFVDTCSADLQVWGRDPDTGLLDYFGQVNEDDSGFSSRFFNQGYRFKFSPDHRYIYGAVDDGVNIVDVTLDTYTEIDFPVQAQNSSTVEGFVEITNNGLATATRLNVSINLGALTPLSVEITGNNNACQQTDNTLACTLERLTPNAGELIRINAMTPANTQSINITSDVSQDQIDLDESNNTDSREIAISTQIPATPTPAPSMTPSPSPTSIPTPPTPTPDNDNSSGNSGGGSINLLLLALMGALSTVKFRRKTKKYSEKSH